MQWEKRIVGPLAANCYLLACTETKRAVVIDPGDEADYIFDLVEGHEWRVEFIIDTHGHFDHTGANGPLKELTGAKLAIHVDDASLLSSQAEHAASYGVSIPASPEPDHLLCDGERLHVGTLNLEIIHTPGHSAGGICISCGNILFSGDTLFAGSIGRSDLPGGNHHSLIDSIRTRLLPLPDETVVLPGHGPATTIGEERRCNPFLNEGYL